MAAESTTTSNRPVRRFEPGTPQGAWLAIPHRGTMCGMEYVCDAPGGKAWFRIETDAEAERESHEMKHAVEKYFRRERDKAGQTYEPTSQTFIERDIGLAAHLKRAMPLFLTLRDTEGAALTTAMLPPGGQDDPNFRIIIVGPANADPYALQDEAIAALGRHFGLALRRERCFPYSH